MSAKDEFLAALNALPDGLGDLLENTIPTAPTIATPTTVDEAVIAQGVLAKYLADVVDAFEGFTPVEALMRIGQKNIVNQALLLAGLQYLDRCATFTIIAPVRNGSYSGHFGIDTFYRAKVFTGTVTAFSVSLGPGDTFDLVQDGDDPTVWAGEWATAIGSHRATFTATAEDGRTAVKTVPFSVVSYPTVPSGGDEVPPSFAIQLDLQDAEGASMSVDVTDESGAVLTTFNLVVDEVQNVWTTVANGLDDLIAIGPEGVGLGLVFRGLVNGMENWQQTVNVICKSL